jgi:photosystem II stability/assembly factor-like uncharacterized protein
MKACIPFAGLLLGLILAQSSLFGFPGLEDTKLPFNCQQDDIQWAGMTCPENEPCAVYLELSSVGSSGSRVFLAGNIHSAQTTLYAVLLRSDDGGATWQEPLERTRGELLDRIQFVNFETGWVSGQRAVPLPGDPFLLITHDGGKSWRKAPVLPEGSAGLIQRFRFDSASVGKVAIDRGASDGDEARYALYETKDGADTWSLVESSVEPLPEAPAPEETLWRLRAGKDGKTVAVEHRTAQGWVAAARFTIQIGECREQ